MNSTVECGVERVLASRGEEYGKLQLALDKLQRVQWIHSLADWEWMSTFTYKKAVGLEKARITFEDYMRHEVPGVSYFYSIEQNPSRDGHHVHSLWADCRRVSSREVWSAWFRRYGRARIEPVRSKGASEDYASKYLCKPNAWWNFNLQLHWKRRIKGVV